MKQFLLHVWTQQQSPASTVTGVSTEKPRHSGELQTYRGDTWYNIYFANFSLKVSKPCITFSAVLCSACLSKNKVVYLFEILVLFYHLTYPTRSLPSADTASTAIHIKCHYFHRLHLLTSVASKSHLDVSLTVHFSHFLFFYPAFRCAFPFLPFENRDTVRDGTNDALDNDDLINFGKFNGQRKDFPCTVYFCLFWRQKCAFYVHNYRRRITSMQSTMHFVWFINIYGF